MAAARSGIAMPMFLRLPVQSYVYPLTAVQHPAATVPSRFRVPHILANALAAAAKVPSAISARNTGDETFFSRTSDDGCQHLVNSASSLCSSSQRAAARPSRFFCRFSVSSSRGLATSPCAVSASGIPKAISLGEAQSSGRAECFAAATESPKVLYQSISSERQLLVRMDALKTQLLAANWQDYLSFVLNSAFWEAEMRLLEVEAGPYVDGSPQVHKGLRDLRRLFDLMAQASDVRDHINQILELSSRATGLAGTGLNATEKVENFEDHVRAAVTEYDRLLKEYPEYCSLIDDSLGSALAMMRQKQRFTFSALHRFFY